VSFPSLQKSTALVVGSLLLWGGADLPAQNAGPGDPTGPRFVPNGVSVPDAWDAQQHLYVKGKLGLPAESLVELEAWLDAKAPNWTVYLARDAAGEAFRDAVGTRFTGMDAVEEAMGTQLPNRTGFGKLVHPETGQRSGAYFILFLGERNFSYHASEVYDAHGLGEENWIGQLDRPAFQAMRGGGRIVDAVKDTILHVDERLARAIDARRSAAKLLKEKALRSIEAAEEIYSYAREEQDDFLERHPEGTTLGELGWEKVRDDLAVARAEQQLGNHEIALAKSSEVRDTLKRWLEGLEEFNSMEAQLTEMKSLLAENPPHAGSESSRQASATASADLVAAETALARGDFRAGEFIRRAADGISRIRAENHATALRVARTRTTAAGGTAGAAVLGSALLFFLNRRRRPSRDEALAQLGEWRAGFRERRDRIFDLLDRCRANVGTGADLKESRTSGTTRELSEEALRDVDELFVMSGCVDRLIDEAENLSRPSGVGSRVRNLFAKKPFARTLELLREKPVEFSPEEGLEMILRREDGKTYEPVIDDPRRREAFRMTFEELVAAFDKKAEEAEIEIERIENGWAQIFPALKGVGDRLEKLGLQSASLLDRSHEDGYLGLPALAESELPRLDEALEAAGTRGETDPVTSVEEDLPALQRQSSEAADLTELLLDFRNESYPIIDQRGRRLVNNGRKTEWIGARLEVVSQQADSLLAGLGERSVIDDVEAVAAGLDDLASDTAEALRIDQAASGPVTARLAAVRDEVRMAREEIAASLGLATKRILDGESVTHGDFNPDTWLDRAEALFPSLDAAVDRGAIPAAGAALQELESHLQEGSDLVSDAREALRENPRRLVQARKRQKQLREKLESHAATVDRLRDHYASDALRIALADSEHLNQAETILPAALNAAKALDHVDDLLPAADGIHADGQLFHAAALLDEILLDHDQVELWYFQINEQEKLLREAEKENVAKIEPLARLVHASAEMTKDHRVSQNTCAEAERIHLQAGELDRLLEAPPGRSNPLEARQRIAAMQEVLDRFEKLVQADCGNHAAAVVTVRDADAQIDVAERLAREARTDEIPDSQGTERSVRETHGLRREHGIHEGRLEERRGDWEQLDRDAHALLQEASRTAAILQAELERARGCIASIHAAAAEVRRARGAAGILGGMFQSAGSSTLHGAHERLRVGDYSGATRLARQALVEASSAIQRARAAEARQRRHAADAARRRRQTAASWSSESSRGGFGGSGRRSSGSSSRGGGTFGSRSRSSTVRSNSGTSRSGW